MVHERLDMLKCIVAYLHRTLAGFLESRNTSVCLVLIFIPARSHAAENRPSAC